MAAPVGAQVGLYVDMVGGVSEHDVIETESGRRYYVIAVRVQARGKHQGRQHLRVVVMSPTDYPPGARTHKIRWYKRGRKAQR
jgi:hypothetical protein